MVLAKLKTRSLLSNRRADCTKYSYDAADRLTTLANVRADSTYVSQYDYTYDNTMNKKRVIEANGDRVTWSYDKAYQLTREQRSGANAYDTTYTYDSASNRRLMIDSGSRTTYTCDVANQLNWLQDNSGRTTFSYDANGNQTLQIVPTLTRTTHNWDGENRLTQVLRSTTDRSTYVHDHNSQRIASLDLGSTKSFTYDRGRYLSQYDTLGPSILIYVNAPLIDDSLISSHSIISKYYHGDGNGNVVQLTDSTTSIDSRYVYNWYGVNVYSNTPSLPFQFGFLGLRNWATIDNSYCDLDYWVYDTRTIAFLQSTAGTTAPTYFSQLYRIVAVNDGTGPYKPRPVSVGANGNDRYDFCHPGYDATLDYKGPIILGKCLFAMSILDEVWQKNCKNGKGKRCRFDIVPMRAGGIYGDLITLNQRNPDFQDAYCFYNIKREKSWAIAACPKNIGAGKSNVDCQKDPDGLTQVIIAIESEKNKKGMFGIYNTEYQFFNFRNCCLCLTNKCTICNKIGYCRQMFYMPGAPPSGGTMPQRPEQR